MSNRRGVELASTTPPPWDGPWCYQCQRPVLRRGVCYTCSPAEVRIRHDAAVAEKWTRHPLAPENLPPFDPEAASGRTDHHR